jgi:hypothetical protein
MDPRTQTSAANDPNVDPDVTKDADPSSPKPQKPTEAEEDSTSGTRGDTESGVDTGAIEPGRSGGNGAFAG